MKVLYRRLSSYKIQSPTADKFKGGYCCLMVLDRCGNISGRDADASFFSSEFPEAKGVPFAALAVYYDGKKYCHQLPAAADADALADAIYGKCESGAGGVGKFSAWPGRQAWIDRQPKKPDQETAPEKSGKDGLDKSVLSIGVPPYWEDPTEKKTYDKWDPGYTGEFEGVPKIGSRPEVTWMLNLADVSTPETTYYLIGSYDLKNSNNCVWQADGILTDYVNSDNKVWTKNAECYNGKFKELYEKGKKYRFFVFYEMSHGGTRSISICAGFTYDDIWNHFRGLGTTQRVWGTFDSCHSESMIIHNGVTPRGDRPQLAAAGDQEENVPEGIFDYLDRKFSRRTALLRSMSNGKTAQAATNPSPRLTLWSSTGAGSYGWYYPGSSTNLTSGMKTAFSETYFTGDGRKYPVRQIRYGWASTDYDYSSAGGDGKGEQAFLKVQKYGKERHGEEPSRLETCIPQCRNYPQKASPETTILFY